MKIAALKRQKTGVYPTVDRTLNNARLIYAVVVDIDWLTRDAHPSCLLSFFFLSFTSENVYIFVVVEYIYFKKHRYLERQTAIFTY